MPKYDGDVGVFFHQHDNKITWDEELASCSGTSSRIPIGYLMDLLANCKEMVVDFKYPTCSGISSRIPIGYLTDLSANYKEMAVGFKSPTYSFSHIE